MCNGLKQRQNLEQDLIEDSCVVADACLLACDFKHAPTKIFDLEGWIFKENGKKGICSVRSTQTGMFHLNP